MHAKQTVSPLTFKTPPGMASKGSDAFANLKACCTDHRKCHGSDLPLVPTAPNDLWLSFNQVYWDMLG